MFYVYADPLMMGDETSSSTMKLQTEYLSSGVNQISMGIDWNTNGTVCYAASTGVLLYDPQVPKPHNFISLTFRLWSSFKNCPQNIHNTCIP